MVARRALPCNTMKPIDDDIKREILYYLKHVAPFGLTFCDALACCSEADMSKFKTESGKFVDSISCFMENAKRSPEHHSRKANNVQPREAPVLSALHNCLIKYHPQTFITMSSDSSSEPSSSSSSGHCHGNKRTPLPTGSSSRKSAG
jgi:hypothetical protein